MKKIIEKNAIVTEGFYYEEVPYHVSNEKTSVIFDGKGAVTYYSEANTREFINWGFCCIHDGGMHIDVLSEKRVEMLGRRQVITVKIPSGTLEIEQFLDKSANGVFMSCSLETEKDNAEVEVVYMQNRIKDIHVFADGNVGIIPENSSMNIVLSGTAKMAKIFFTFREEYGGQLDAAKEYDAALKNCIAEINTIKLPAGLSETEKAMFYSAYFCALENYKEKDDYKAFMAGHKYLLPMRSYYRDSYYTVLPMYNGHTDKVRNQILVLAKGVEESGTCPSAVKSDYSAWWSGHYDSPSFLAMMLYDYVKYTGDRTILDEIIGKFTVLDQAARALAGLAEKERENGLLYKEGRYNKCDWADEVNRSGYVTYDELLYARAHNCLGMLMEWKGEKEKSAFYKNKFQKIKDAVNSELWDEKLGYYVNFKNDEYTESNLSIDTVFAALFGIADEKRAIRMLTNMEKLLESRSNKDIKVKDFGVLCVYPLYSRADSAYKKASQPYNYHNGANWPYLSAIYACAKRKYGMEYKYALESWFEQNIENGNYTPVEYYSPVCEDGSLLQGWCGAAAFVLDEELSRNFWDEEM